MRGVSANSLAGRPFCTLPARFMLATGNNMKPGRSPVPKLPAKAPTGICRPKNPPHAPPVTASMAAFWTGTTRSMKPGETLPARDANEEAFALIEVLHETEQRLEEMTADKLDAVVDRHGLPVLLRRHIAAAKQVAILNALPAHVALLDGRG